MKLNRLLIAVTLCAGLASQAFAEQGKKTNENAAETESGTPPGLQKKGGFPPGQAKKRGQQPLPHDVLITNAPATNVPAHVPVQKPIKRGDVPPPGEAVKKAPAPAPAATNGAPPASAR